MKRVAGDGGVSYECAVYVDHWIPHPVTAATMQPDFEADLTSQRCAAKVPPQPESTGEPPIPVDPASGLSAMIRYK